MTRDHNAKQRWQPYIANPHYKETKEHQSEVKIEMFVLRVFNGILSIPAAFGRAFSRKKITKDRKKSQGIPNNLFDDLDSFEE